MTETTLKDLLVTVRVSALLGVPDHTEQSGAALLNYEIEDFNDCIEFNPEIAAADDLYAKGFVVLVDEFSSDYDHAEDIEQINTALMQPPYFPRPEMGTRYIHRPVTCIFNKQTLLGDDADEVLTHFGVFNADDQLGYEAAERAATASDLQDRSMELDAFGSVEAWR